MKRYPVNDVICALVMLLYGFAAGAAAATAPKKGQSGPVQVRITQVDVGLSDAGPVVLLKAEGRAIPIFVDPTVAESIHAALTGGKTRRPFPHELMHSVLSAYDGSVTEVAITLKGAIYHAALTVIVSGNRKTFDSRASDAIALAVHFKAPIHVSRALLESAGQELEKPRGTPL
jgi:bifunctional DNase/RNase